MGKSRELNIGGSKVSFEFSRVDGKLIGITKDGTPVDPRSNEFDRLANTGTARQAFNVNKFGGNKKSYVGIFGKADRANDEELLKNYNDQTKKSDNQQFVDNNSPLDSSVAFATPRATGNAYRRGKQLGSEFMTYPLDIDLQQDHFKITRYEYRRPSINESKPRRTVRRVGVAYKNFQKEFNVAGDSVKGSRIGGSIILPMPKPTDVNGVAWGKDEQTISGLAALGLAQKGTGLTSFLTGLNATGKSPEATSKDFFAGLRKFDGNTGEGARGLAQAKFTQFSTKLAGKAFGVELDPDTFLARAGGRVINPNAEMLFQGPSIRDFAFEFTMIARSKKEGEEIRKIIRFLKVGMAPKFENTSFLANPDVFQLEYKNGVGEFDMLKTVNQFNPGGLALTAMNVDYAPNGYWSAYTDSQPVALKMSLNFTELRPIYQSDQELGTPFDSVGY